MNHPPQEPDVLPGRALTGVGLGVVCAAGAGVLIALLIGRCRSVELGRQWVPPMASPQITGEMNGIETEPFSVEAQGLDQHQQEDQRLRRYGWIDKAHQIVYIPIDAAIELYLAKQTGGGK